MKLIRKFLEAVIIADTTRRKHPDRWCHTHGSPKGAHGCLDCLEESIKAELQRNEERRKMRQQFFDSVNKDKENKS